MEYRRVSSLVKAWIRPRVEECSTHVYASYYFLAGKGAVLGPLVYAAAAFTPAAVQELKHLGVKDSKKLSKRRQLELYPIIRALAAGHCTLHVPAPEVSADSSGLILA